MVLSSGWVRDAMTSVIGTKGDGVLIGGCCLGVVWNLQTTFLGIWPWVEQHYLFYQQFKVCAGDTCLPLETHPTH